MGFTNILFAAPPSPPRHFLFRSAADDFLLICHVFFVSVVLSCSIHIGGTVSGKSRKLREGGRLGLTLQQTRFETKMLKINVFCKNEDFLSVQKYKILVREEPTSAGRTREIEK